MENKELIQEFISKLEGLKQLAIKQHEEETKSLIELRDKTIENYNKILNKSWWKI